MYIPKRYGESRIDRCPFCEKIATTTNSQKVPVCLVHKNSTLGDMRCACGEYLDMKESKFGVFFTCMKCGCISLSKALEVNGVSDAGSGAAPGYKVQRRKGLNAIDRETRERREGIGLAGETYRKPDKPVEQPNGSNTNTNSPLDKTTSKDGKKRVIFVDPDDPRYFD